MERITARCAVVLTCLAIVAAMCGMTALQPHTCTAPAVAATTSLSPGDEPTPTLAPPMKVVVVQVETDKLDIEVGWADN